MLLASDERRLGVLSAIWELQSGFDGDDYREEELHDRLERREPSYGTLLAAIRAYEGFSRAIQDGFDVLKAEAARPDVEGFSVPEIRRDADFQKSVKDLHVRFEKARQALSEITIANVSLPNLFAEKLQAFGEPLEAGTCAVAMCAHHEAVQKGKSVEGKRPWFDRLGGDRIYVRHAYREQRRDIQPGRYVHDYRGRPIRRFWRDLA
jgi:hypothetical protein